MSDPLTLGIGLGVAVLAKVLANQLIPKDPVKDLSYEPTTLSQRGSRAPWVIGARRVGAVVCWAGERKIQNEKVSSAGKGLGTGPGSETKVFYEAAVHTLCINNGRARAIRRILQAGEPIFEGPITPETHPTGTIVTLANGEGSFEIRWGLLSDPIDAWAGAPSRIGIPSRFPRFLRINWRSKRLGQTANWPILDYVVEVEPTDPTGELNSDHAWIPGPPEKKPLPQFFAIRSKSLGAGSNVFLFWGHISGFLFADNKILVEDFALLPDESTFTIASVSYAPAQNLSATIPIAGALSVCPVTAPGYAFNGEVTIVTVVEDPGIAFTAPAETCELFESTNITKTTIDYPDGTTSVVVDGPGGGANPAHLLSQALFAEPPLGVGSNQARYDPSSLAALSDQMVLEGYRASVTAEQGASLQTILNNLLTDIGCFVVLDDQTGLLTFKVLRPDLIDTIEIPAEAVQSRPVEDTTVVTATRLSRLEFSFVDEELNFKDRVFTLSADGITVLGGMADSEPVQIHSTVSFDVAAMEAKRREAEAFGDTTSAKVRVGFDGRKIRPGDLLSIAGLTGKKLVYESQTEDSQTGAELQVASNAYLAPPTPQTLLPQGSAPADAQAVGVALAWLLDVPDALKGSSLPAAVALFWIRTNALASDAILYLSADGLTYSAFGSEPAYCTGGILQDEILNETAGAVPLVPGDIHDTQPLLAFEGPDTGIVQDLTGSPASYDAGQQLALVSSTAGVELMALRSVSFSSATTGALIDLKRGLYGTPVLSHSPGASVFIFPSSSWVEFTDAGLLVPTTTIYYKVQAIGAGSITGIEDITPVALELA